MPQRQQSVVRVFAIQRIILPVAAESALAAPEGVHEVEGFFFDRLDVGLHAGQGVQGGGGRKQVGDRGGGGGEETALGMRSGKKPVGQGGIDRLIELPQERDGGG